MNHIGTANQGEALGPDANRALVELLNQKSPQAGPLLDRLYREALIRFCFGYFGQLEEAEDAVQEICLQVLRVPFVPEHLRPWLYKISRNHCLKALRDRPQFGRRLRPSTQLSASITGQLTRMVREELRDRMDLAYQSLAEDQREVLRLRYVENLSRAEIGEVLDLPESLVKSRLYEGIKKLREEAERMTSS